MNNFRVFPNNLSVFCGIVAHDQNINFHDGHKSFFSLRFDWLSPILTFLFPPFVTLIRQMPQFTSCTWMELRIDTYYLVL